MLTYSPDLYFSYPLYFDYSTPGMPPTCVVPLADQVTTLFSKQRDSSVRLKDVILDLEFPETKQNIDAGIFMISLELKDSENDTIFHSHRPHMLKYKGNPLYEHVETITYLPFYLLGFKEFKQKVRLSMLIHTDRHQIDLLNKQLSNVALLIARLSTSQVQIYHASAHFISEVVGWRYFTYHHPWITLFMIVPVVAMFEALSLFWFMLILFVYCLCIRPSNKKKLKQNLNIELLSNYDRLEKESPIEEETIITHVSVIENTINDGRTTTNVLQTTSDIELPVKKQVKTEEIEENIIKEEVIKSEFDEDMISTARRRRIVKKDDEVDE